MADTGIVSSTQPDLRSIPSGVNNSTTGTSDRYSTSVVLDESPVVSPPVFPDTSPSTTAAKPRPIPAKRKKRSSSSLSVSPTEKDSPSAVTENMDKSTPAFTNSETNDKVNTIQAQTITPLSSNLNIQKLSASKTEEAVAEVKTSEVLPDTQTTSVTVQEISSGDTTAVTVADGDDQTGNDKETAGATGADIEAADEDGTVAEGKETTPVTATVEVQGTSSEQKSTIVLPEGFSFAENTKPNEKHYNHDVKQLRLWTVDLEKASKKLMKAQKDVHRKEEKVKKGRISKYLERRKGEYESVMKEIQEGADKILNYMETDGQMQEETLFKRSWSERPYKRRKRLGSDEGVDECERCAEMTRREFKMAERETKWRHNIDTLKEQNRKLEKEKDDLKGRVRQLTWENKRLKGNSEMADDDTLSSKSDAAEVKSGLENKLLMLNTENSNLNMELSRLKQQRRNTENKLRDLQHTIEKQRKRMEVLEMKLEDSGGGDEKDSAGTDDIKLIYRQSSSLSDIEVTPERIVGMVNDLYDNEWRDACDELEKYLEGDFRTCPESLLDILKVIYEECQIASTEQLQKLENLFLCPFSMQGDLPQFVDGSLPEKTRDQIRNIRMTFTAVDSTITNAIPFIEKCFKDEEADQVYTQYLSKEHVSKYLTKCVEICWLMAIQEPPMTFGCDLPNGSPFDNQLFKEYTREGQIVDFVVLPPLFSHAAGHMLSKGIAEGKNESEET